MENFQDWTYDDFLTYLLILGANADLEFSEEEQEVIEKKSGEERYKKIRRCFDRQNDSQRIDTVSELYARFESKIGGKEKLVEAVKEIITLNDRTAHVMDNYLMMMLKKIL